MKKTLFATALLATTGLYALTACGPRTERSVIQNKGSDTLVTVAQAWAEEYAVVNPAVAVAVSGGGSGTGIASLMDGTVDIANSSRKLKDREMKAAEEKGFTPVEHIVGYDALAVFVHPDNPMSEVSISQLAAIYGDGGTAEKWSDLGLTVPGCPSDEIVRVSRQNNSGTYEYFREAVLHEGDFRLGSRDMHGSKDVVDLVEKTPCAIGYSGLAYATEHVKMPCVKMTDDGACVTPNTTTAKDGTYGIARPLFMYTRGEPEGVVKDYLDWIESDTGQCVLAKKGYAPVRDVKCE